MSVPQRTSFASGASKRKKLKQTSEFIATQAGALDRFVVKRTRNDENHTVAEVVSVAEHIADEVNSASQTVVELVPIRSNL